MRELEGIDPESLLVPLDSRGDVKRPNKGGRPAGSKDKPKKGIPSKKEWEGISRLMFTSIKERLEHRDEDTGLPTAPPALYATVANLIKQTQTTVQLPKEEPMREQLDKLQQLRKNRKKLLPHSNDEYTERVKKSQRQTGAIRLDEEPSLPDIPWGACNTLDPPDEE